MKQKTDVLTAVLF